MRIVALIAVWAGLVGFGFLSLLSYKGTPGAAAGEISDLIESTFPADAFPSEHDGPTPRRAPRILLFAHPCCPCTTASLRELSKLITERPELQPAEVIFTLPPGAPAEWRSTPLVEQVRNTPGFHVTLDDNGQLTKRCGAHTSGQVLLYDAAGRRVFAGGITPLRGHEGYSTGRGLIIAACENPAAPPTTAPVFGCPLLNHSQRAGGGS